MSDWEGRTRAPVGPLREQVRHEADEQAVSDADQSMADLNQTMADSDKVAAAVERGCADAVEAAALEDRLGEDFDAMVVELRNSGRALVQVSRDRLQDR